MISRKEEKAKKEPVQKPDTMQSTLQIRMDGYLIEDIRKKANARHISPSELARNILEAYCLIAT